MDISEVRKRADAFAETLAATKAELEPEEFWYPFGSIWNFVLLEQLLTEERRDFTSLLDGGPIADIGGADGDCAFFLETLGYEVHLIDNPPTNYNGLRGARRLKEALNSSVEIIEADIDSQSTLPNQRYAAVLFLGILYHTKNPFYVLEQISYRTRRCFLSTRVTRFSPEGTDLMNVPVGYLLDKFECNNDPTNYWVFSHAGLRRLAQRSGWEIQDEMWAGDTATSEPARLDRDERFFALLSSKRELAGG